MTSQRQSYEGLEVVDNSHLYGLELANTLEATPLDLQILFVDEQRRLTTDIRKNIQAPIESLAEHHNVALRENLMRRQKHLLWSCVFFVWFLAAFGAVFGGIVIKRRSHPNETETRSVGYIPVLKRTKAKLAPAYLSLRNLQNFPSLWYTQRCRLLSHPPYTLRRL
jgi:hypothetical protein